MCTLRLVVMQIDRRCADRCVSYPTGEMTPSGHYRRRPKMSLLGQAAVNDFLSPLAAPVAANSLSVKEGSFSTVPPCKPLSHLASTDYC